MESDTHKTGLLSSIPPWILIGVVAVLFPILGYMTLEGIHRQKANSIRLLQEKGAALIRSFEAGTRTGMMGSQWGLRHLEQLLEETARQEDIAWLLVADTDGRVIAHSNPEFDGTFHGRDLDLKAVAESRVPLWRQIEGPDGKPIFEIYRRFEPTRDHSPGRRMMMHDMMRRRFGRELRREPFGDDKDLVIFVGLDMTGIEAAQTADIRHSIFMGILLLLVGLAGFFLLFLLQSYRAQRVSFHRLKSFSENLMDNMPMGLISVDDRRRIASVNNAAADIMGVDSRAVTGRPIDEVMPAELIAILDQLGGGKTMVEQEMDCCLKSDRPLPVAVVASAWYAEDGVRLGRLLLIKDLTEIQALRKEVARSQRLASIGSLAAGVAHEIRNPLSSIKGFATYFKQRYRDNPKDEETARVMIQEVDRLNRVVGQLLELSRPVNIRTRAIDLKTVVETAVAVIRREADDQQVRIEIDLDSAPAHVQADPDRLQQLLLNLFLNALEAMAPGGTLSVRLAPESVDRFVITVSDTGSGIPAADQQQIFDPYFTTKSTGTGLGLAIVHNIVEAHNGSVGVSSRPGAGTTFTIQLPRHQKEAAHDD